MELFLAIINVILLFGVTIGVYKQKVDHGEKHSDQIDDIDRRLIRLEEKVTFIYNTLKTQK